MNRAIIPSAFFNRSGHQRGRNSSIDRSMFDELYSILEWTGWCGVLVQQQETDNWLRHKSRLTSKGQLLNLSTVSGLSTDLIKQQNKQFTPANRHNTTVSIETNPYNLFWRGDWLYLSQFRPTFKTSISCRHVFAFSILFLNSLELSSSTLKAINLKSVPFCACSHSLVG